MRKTIIAAMSIAISIPAVTFADEIEDAVKARRDHMKARGGQMGTLAKMAKGEVEYDAAAAQAAADELAKLVNIDTGPWWLPGSSSDDLPGATRALPALWADGGKVMEVAAPLGPAAAALQEAAGKGKGEMTAALGATGKACDACHDLYQKPKE